MPGNIFYTNLEAILVGSKTAGINHDESGLGSWGSKRETVIHSVIMIAAKKALNKSAGSMVFFYRNTLIRMLLTCGEKRVMPSSSILSIMYSCLQPTLCYFYPHLYLVFCSGYFNESLNT